MEIDNMTPAQVSILLPKDKPNWVEVAKKQREEIAKNPHKKREKRRKRRERRKR